MNSSEMLRMRLLSALGAGLLAALAAPLGCSGSTSPAEQREELTPRSCSFGQPEVQCFPPGQTHFNVGNTPTPPALPEPIFDENGCQVMDQVADGCCNAAQSGPELINGECCYGFCTGACCGRPLMVGGAARLAAAERRSDWIPRSSGSIEADLDGSTRAELVDAWLLDARMEHASIASFARFSLELLALGAPAELVAAAARAQADEIRHAQDCFRVATLYAGQSYGPGALEMSGVAPASSLAEAAVSAIREGCVGETVAALIARERARGTQAAEPRAVLERIAEDEARHAELAWLFVRWAARSGGPSVRAAIADAFRALGVPAGAPAEPTNPTLRAHGCISPGEARELERMAVLEVVEPCARALLAELAPASLAPPQDLAKRAAT